jgi:hypothetical protein
MVLFRHGHGPNLPASGTTAHLTHDMAVVRWIEQCPVEDPQSDGGTLDVSAATGRSRMSAASGQRREARVRAEG